LIVVEARRYAELVRHAKGCCNQRAPAGCQRPPNPMLSRSRDRVRKKLPRGAGSL